MCDYVLSLLSVLAATELQRDTHARVHMVYVHITSCNLSSLPSCISFLSSTSHDCTVGNLAIYVLTAPGTLVDVYGIASVHSSVLQFLPRTSSKAWQAGVFLIKDFGLEWRGNPVPYHNSTYRYWYEYIHTYSKDSLTVAIWTLKVAFLGMYVSMYSMVLLTF